MGRVIVPVLVLVSLLSSGASAQSTSEMLQAFIDDYRHDPMAINGTFGIRIGDDWWTVSIQRKQNEYRHREKFTLHEFGPHSVALQAGKPHEPTWYFELADENVLRKLSDGSLTAGTASARSFESDKVALSTKSMEGFDLDAGAVARMYHIQSHFWARGTPEVTHFEREKSLPTHGASMVGLAGMKDKRIAWFSIGPQETANEDPRLEAGQVPNLMIFTKGRGRARFADKVMDVHEGMSVFIGPYVKHVISNPYDEPLEGILVLYGDNGDFVRGVSYLDFTEDIYDFYSGYPFERGRR